MDHAVFQELAAGAVLEDLDPSELERLEDHLAGCIDCSALSDRLHDVVWDLALLTPESAPPPALQGRVLQAVRATASDAPVQLHPHRSVQLAQGPRARRRWTTLAPLALAAALGAVAIGLGGRVVQLTQESADAAVAAEDAAGQIAAREGAMAVLVSPDHQTATLESEALAPEAKAVAVFEPGTTESYVMVADLPATPPGHVYQLWYADAAGVHPLGTYHHLSGMAFVAPFGVDLASSDAAMITLEPDGGAVGEPGPQVVFGEL